MAVADPGRRFGDDVIAMAEAAAATRWARGHRRRARGAHLRGLCRPGDALGSAEGDVVVIGADLAAVACDLLDRLLGAGGELATSWWAPTRRWASAASRHLAATHPTVEVVTYEGGAAAVPLLVGVE